MTRELDIEVGEKVMGWADVGTHVHCRKCPMAIDHTEFVPHGNTPDGKRVIVPEYSTDISAAWLVVERVQQVHPGWRFALLGGDTTNVYTTPHGSKHGGFFGWKAEFFGHEDAEQNYGQRHGEAYEQTAPEAICRAALAAMGE